MNTNTFLFQALCVCTFFLCGCGKHFSVAPISGTVNLSGKPIADCCVSFEPKDGNEIPAASAITDSSGTFALETVESPRRRKGAVPGEYVVRFCWLDPAMKNSDYNESKTNRPPYEIPLKYQSDGITFEVPSGGKTDVVFDLVP